MEASIILKGSRVEQIDAQCVADKIDSRQLMANAGGRVSATIIKDFKDIFPPETPSTESFKPVNRSAEAFNPDKRTAKTFTPNNASAQAFLPANHSAEAVKGAIICGGGNNGGDGFVAAVNLINAGAAIDVFCITGSEKFSPDSKYYFDILSNKNNAKIHFLNLEDIGSRHDFILKLENADFIVDAIFGTGLRNREIQGPAKTVIGLINSIKGPRPGFKKTEQTDLSSDICAESKKSRPLDISLAELQGESLQGPGVLKGGSAFIYSIDIPSGIDSDSAQILGAAVKADKTITFGCKKLGIVLYPGKDYAGEVVVADIGIPLKYYQSYEKIYEADLAWVASKLTQRHSGDYKHSVGKLLVIAGSLGFSGAAAMVCEAAMRTGAGMVTLVCPWELNSVLEIKLTETMTYPVEQTDDVSIHADAFEEILELSDKFDALAIGPGLSQNPSTICLVREILKQIKKPVVLDADGLRALYGPMEIETGSSLKLPNVIITPHSGEMASILGKDLINPQERFSANYEAVKRFGAVSVLKGASTIITDPAMVSFINTTGSWALATAGTGDILTGIIGSLLAQGMKLNESAACGAFIHGMASDIMVESTGKTSQIATDLLEGIKKVFIRIEKIKYPV